MLLILRQDGAASAWRAAGVRACRAAAHLEEQEVAAGRAEVHAGLVRWRRNLRWGWMGTHLLLLHAGLYIAKSLSVSCGALSPRGSAGKDVSSAHQKHNFDRRPPPRVQPMPVDVASAIPVKKPGQEPGSTIPVKILGGCAVLLMATMLYNSIGGWHAQSHGQRSVQPAALPLQRRMRKSRFARQDDADSPSEVAVELQPQPEPEPQLQPDPARAQPSLTTLSTPRPQYAHTSPWLPGDGRGARHARRQGHGQGPRRSG